MNIKRLSLLLILFLFNSTILYAECDGNPKHYNIIDMFNGRILDDTFDCIDKVISDIGREYEKKPYKGNDYYRQPSHSYRETYSKKRIYHYSCLRETKLRRFLDKESDNNFIAFCGGDEIYYVHLLGSKVDGGFAQGSAKWKILYGIIDGHNLIVKFETNERGGCLKTWLHQYEIGDSFITLKNSVNACNEVISNRNVKYKRIYK